MLFGLSGISVAAIPGEDKGIDLSAVFPNGTTVTYEDVVQYLLLHSDNHSFLAALPNSYMEVDDGYIIDNMYLQIASARDEYDSSRFWGLNTDYVRLFYISSPSSDFGKENRLTIEWKYGEPFWPSGRAFRLVFTNELIDVLKTMSYTERLMYVAAIYLELHRSDEVCAWYYEARYKLTRDDYENLISSDSGDANCDGEVNAIDLLLLKKYLAGYEPAFDPYLAAINRDNRILMLDVFQLKKLFAFGKKCKV